MFDYQTFRLMHLHGDERFPMKERSPHDPAETDPERGWVQGARIFRCNRCAEEILLIPPGHDVPGTEPV
jgi:hypothetical protein